MKRTKFLIVYAALTTGVIGLTGCSDETKDVIVRAEQLTMDNFSTGYITAVEKDRGVTWKWDLLPENMQMDITVLRENLPYTHELTRATSIEQKDMDEAKRLVEIIATDFEAGQILTGRVVSIKEFGAFVEFAPGKEGMVHISKICRERINRVEDVLTLGDKVKVVCLGKDKMGRFSFSIKDVPKDER